MGNEIVIRPPLDKAELQQALDLRQDVFIVEQGRNRRVDADKIDLTCQHIVAVEGNEVVGTLRLYLLNPGDRDIKIGRVAVRKDRRRAGIGRLIMDAGMRWAMGKYESLYLHSQVTAVEFYAKQGYVSEGPIFMESGTEHIVMRRQLDRD